MGKADASPKENASPNKNKIMSPRSLKTSEKNKGPGSPKAGKGAPGSPKAGSPSGGEKPELDIPEELKGVVGKMTELDDEYMKLEKEYMKEQLALQAKYTKLQKPFLDQRLQVLQGSPPEKKEGDSDPAQPSGTPSCPNFWLQALQNFPPCRELVEDWDEEILGYLKDITTEYLDETDTDKGFRLSFEFAENPFFANTTLTRTYHTKEENPWTGETKVLKCEGTKIDWKPGKDVTVEVTKKKVTGGGAKKKKQQGKEKIEPRDSFFRFFFRDMEEGGELPGLVRLDEEDDEDDMDPADILESLMDDDHEKGSYVKDTLIPHAVRWFTGEAMPDGDDDDDDESDEDDEDGDDDDDDDEEEAAPSPKGKKKAGGKKAGGGEAGKKEDDPECKQQ